MKWVAKVVAALTALFLTTGLPGVNTVLAQEARSPLEKAIVGMGGEDVLSQLDTLVIEASGMRWNHDEGFTPDEPLFSNSYAVTVSHDLAGDALRVDHDDTIRAFGLDAPQRYSEVLAGDVGYIDGVDNIFGIPARAMPSDRWAAIRKQHRLLNPQLILRDVATDPSLASDGGLQLVDGSLHHLVVVEDEVYPITLYVNAATGHVAKAATMENHFLHRDVPLEVFYLNWQPTDAGLQVPREVAMALDGKVILDERRSAVRANEALDASRFEFPDDAAPSFDADLAQRGERTSQFYLGFVALGLPQEGVQASVEATELAPGVHHLTGGTHHSLVVEQANGLVVIEAPLYEARSEAILAWIDENLPDEPISHVVVSHFHEDHSAGVRTFVAAGATVVVSEKSADFFADVLAAPSTVQPDALERSPVPFEIESVPTGAALTLPDPERPVTVVPLENSHAHDLVVTHLPSSEALFVVDVYTPGEEAQLLPSGPADLMAGIERHDLTVSTLVGGHGGTATIDALEALVDR